MRFAALRWWLLTRAARSCGLKVGITASDPSAPVVAIPRFVVFSSDDAATFEVAHVLAHTFRTDAPRGPDPRLHTEWTH